ALMRARASSCWLHVVRFRCIDGANELQSRCAARALASVFSGPVQTRGLRDPSDLVDRANGKSDDSSGGRSLHPSSANSRREQHMVVAPRDVPRTNIMTPTSLDWSNAIAIGIAA